MKHRDSAVVELSFSDGKSYEVRVPWPNEPTIDREKRKIEEKARANHIRSVGGWSYAYDRDRNVQAQYLRYERAETRPGYVQRFAGQCQYCERFQKLDDSASAMVLHGYRRPGIGYTVGECPGVDLPPYELSCDAIKGWLAGAVTQATALTETITLHESTQRDYRAYRIIPKERWVKPKWAPDLPVDRQGMPIEHEETVFVPNETDPERQAEYARIRQLVIDKLVASLGSVLGEIDRYEKRINDWKLKPAITVEELERLSQHERAPLMAVLPKEVAGLGKSLSEGRKAKLYPALLEVLLPAIGWSMNKALVPVKFTSANHEELPIPERLVALGAPLMLPPDGKRLDRGNYVGTGYDKAGDMVVQPPLRWRLGNVNVTMSEPELAKWRASVVEVLSRLPSAPPKGPTPPYHPSGLYVTRPRVKEEQRAGYVDREVMAENVWVIVPAFEFVAASGKTFMVPEIYGVDYDREALKPAGFYKWADENGIREAIKSLIPSEK